MNTKFLKVLFVLFVFPIVLLSQTSHGFAFDNYNGIYGVTANPANSVDSKYNIHVNVLSYNQLGSSDMGSLHNFQLEAVPNGFNGLNFSNNFEDGKDGYSFGHSDIMLPSVVWNFHENFAIGLVSRYRSMFDYNNVNGNLLQVLSANPQQTNDFTFDNQELNNTAHSFTEFGLNLSAVVVNSNYHFVKFGGTIKYYSGERATEVAGSLSGSLNNNDLQIGQNTANPLIHLNTAENTGAASSQESFVSSAFNFSNSGSGVGGDVGIVYEWRPRETNRVNVRSNSSAVNKYKIKISASVLDVGTISYKEALKDSIIVNSTANVVSNNTINQENNLIANLIASENSTNIPRQGEVKFALPRSLHLNFDYIILNDNNYYININYVKSLNTATDLYANTQMDMVTLTPRYETRKFSIYLPVSLVSNTGEITAGLGARYGPVTIGVAALSSMFTNNKVSHLYFGLSIPLMKELYR